MTMPLEVVFARHGESEANVVQKRDNHGLDPEVARQILARPDWQQRLTLKGIEQAKRAKEWIDRNMGAIASFDALYVSPFIRCRETASYMAGVALAGWTMEDRVAERSWGVYGKRSREDQRMLFPMTYEEKRANPFYAILDGGENMPMVSGRYRDFQGTLHREQEGKRVFVVCHGDFMNNVRYNIERMTPEAWEDLDRDPTYAFKNCMLLNYTRKNPNDPDDIREKITWRRYIDTQNVDESPDGGEWAEIPKRQRYTGYELLEQAERYPRLIPAD